jgi:hypothetical protein
VLDFFRIYSFGAKGDEFISNYIDLFGFAAASCAKTRQLSTSLFWHRDSSCRLPDLR